MTTPGTDRDGQAALRQPEHETLPLPIAILLGAARMRRAVSRSRRLPGLPLLLLARRHARWTAQSPGFELPWLTGRMIGEPGSSDHALPPPSAAVAVSRDWPDQAAPLPPGAVAVSATLQDRAAASLTQLPSPLSAPTIPAAARNDDGALPTAANVRAGNDLGPDRASGPQPRRDMQVSTPHERGRDVSLPTLASIVPGLVLIERRVFPTPWRHGGGMPRIRAATPSLAGFTGRIDAARPAAAGHAAPSLPSRPAAARLMTRQVSDRVDASAPLAPGRGDASPPHQLHAQEPLAIHQSPDRSAEPPMPSRTIAMAGPASAAGAPASSERRTQNAADAPLSAMTALTGKSAALLPPLVASGTPPTSHNIGNLLALAVGLRGFLGRELDDLRRQIAAFTSRPHPAAARPEPAADDDTARRMLSRMRTITQEERFRSGKLR
jgi:hypothetical protein